MFDIRTIDIERKSVFFINSSLIVLIIIFFLFNIPTSYFFYFNIILTFILSYIFFKRSKALSKALIITNIFIFFYFLYPSISSYLYALLGEESYMFILFYNILLAYIFIVFSSEHKHFLKNIKKTNFKILGIVILIGLLFGLLFYFVKEPVPLNSLFNPIDPSYIQKVAFYTIVLAISEQIIFSGFLFNTYKKLTHQKEAYFQVAVIFLLFHLLRFQNLLQTYIRNFDSYFLILMILYYALLVIFMLTALYFYNFKSKKYEGNFIYPVILHFVTDFTMFILIKIFGY